MAVPQIALIAGVVVAGVVMAIIGIALCSMRQKTGVRVADSSRLEHDSQFQDVEAGSDRGGGSLKWGQLNDRPISSGLKRKYKPAPRQRY